MSEEDLELDDDALAFAAGGIKQPDPSHTQGPIESPLVSSGPQISNFSDHHLTTP